MNYLVIVTIALITALVCAVIFTPLAGRNRRMTIMLCLILVPGVTLSTYLAIGNPDRQGAYAAFEAPKSERARKRDMLARISKLERTVDTTAAPDIRKLIELGTLRQRIGRHKKAIAAFERADAMSEHYATLSRKLGKAYFRAGVMAMRKRRRDKAATYWQKALVIAPRDAPYLPVIDRAVQRFKNREKN